MKKLILFITLIFAITIAIAQESETTPSTSLGEYQIEVVNFNAHINISNESIIKDLVLTPDNSYKDMYLAGNWGTFTEKITFNTDIKTNTVKFVFVSRVVQVGEAYKLVKKEKGKKVELVDMLGAELLNDIKSKKILCVAEFTLPTGEKVKKNIEINFDKNSSPDGDEVFAVADITNEILGLNVLTLKVQSPIGFPFSLQNKEYDLSLVVKANDAGDIKCLASKVMRDGAYSFVCRIALPNGTAAQETIEAFVKDGEILLDQSSFNPLAFADTSNATFSGKRSMVKIINTRNEDVVIFIPESYFAKTGQNISVSLDSRTFDKTIKWKTFVLPPGGKLKLMLKTSYIKTLVFSATYKKAEIYDLGVAEKPTQRKYLGWSGFRSN